MVMKQNLVPNIESIDGHLGDVLLFIRSARNKLKRDHINALDHALPI